MNRNAATRRLSGLRRVVPRGRPPRERAGEVDARILDAARRVFLERGLAGATIDEIASVSGASKPTIYSRFPSKEALFTAVVTHYLDVSKAKSESDVHTGVTIEERFASVAISLLQWALSGDVVDVFRMVIAESRRFPDLARAVDATLRVRAEDNVGRLLQLAVQSDELGSFPAFSPERQVATTHFFIDLILWPVFKRALLGEKLKVVRAGIHHHVASGIVFFLAGCRNGGVK
jgi:AcrR family transcriptional regulator